MIKVHNNDAFIYRRTGKQNSGSEISLGRNRIGKEEDDWEKRKMVISPMEGKGKGKGKGGGKYLVRDRTHV